MIISAITKKKGNIKGVLEKVEDIIKRDNIPEPFKQFFRFVREKMDNNA